MTVDLQIEKPIQVSMNIIEIVSERLPSFKMDIKCKIPHPTGTFLYEANDIWFECQAWDFFNKQVSKILLGSAESAMLADMSEYFIINIITDERNSYSFQLKCHESEMSGGMVQLSYQTKIDIDTISIIERAFLSFPIWW